MEMDINKNEVIIEGENKEKENEIAVTLKQESDIIDNNIKDSNSGIIEKQKDIELAGEKEKDENKEIIEKQQMDIGIEVTEKEKAVKQGEEEGEGENNNLLVQETIKMNEIALKPEEEEKIKEGGLSIEKIGTENIIEGDKKIGDDIAIAKGTEGTLQIEKITEEKLEPSTDKDQIKIKTDEGTKINGNIISEGLEVKIDGNVLPDNENQVEIRMNEIKDETNKDEKFDNLILLYEILQYNEYDNAIYGKKRNGDELKIENKEAININDNVNALTIENREINITEGVEPNKENENANEKIESMNINIDGQGINNNLTIEQQNVDVVDNQEKKENKEGELIIEKQNINDEDGKKKEEEKKEEEKKEEEKKEEEKKEEEDKKEEEKKEEEKKEEEKKEEDKKEEEKENYDKFVDKVAMGLIYLDKGSE